MDVRAHYGTQGSVDLGICRGPWNQSPIDTEGQLHRLMSVLLEKYWVGQKFITEKPKQTLWPTQ